MSNNNSFEKQLLIQQVRNVGESLIKNAENIVGDDVYRVSLDISASIKSGEVPTIHIYREFVPERSIK